jgi:sugar lactone lactonase YvrE
VTTSRVGFAAIAQALHLGGLAVDGDTVWYSDVVGGGVYRVAPDTTIEGWLPERRFVGGLAANQGGTVLVGGAGGIVWLDPETGRSGELLSEVEGEALPGVNEMCPDGRGGIYFGTVDIPSIEAAVTPRPSGLFHLAVDGTARQLTGGLVFTNGVDVSPNGKFLYHNESFVGTFAYPIEPGGGLGERRMLLEKEDVDGLTLDADGNLWVTGFSSADILCLNPDGEIVGGVEVPEAGGVGNFRFGGDDGRDMYITRVVPGASERLKAGQLPTEPEATLLRAPSPVAGRVVAPAAFPVG